MTDDIFAAQSVELYLHYYNLRIFVHRPFITFLRAHSLPFPSAAICTSAARSSLQMLERHFARFGGMRMHQAHFVCPISWLWTVYPGLTLTCLLFR